MSLRYTLIMDVQHLTYSPQVHELYRAAAADFQTRLCRGEIDMGVDGPTFPIDCLAACANHKVEVKAKAITRHVARVNIAAHTLLEAQLSAASKAERAAYHAGLVDISRQYFPFFEELLAQKEAVLTHKRHLTWRQQKRERNLAIEMLIEPEEVPAACLFEFMACYRKRSYASFEEADTALSSGFHGPEEGYAIYACSHCPGWHVGHPPDVTTPLEYKLSRARMVWATKRALANRFVKERNVLRTSQTY